MNRCRIIFSDIDGTLLNTNHQLPENTRKKILELDEKGIPFVLVSARMPEGIFPIQEGMGIHSPIVAFSGGLVLDQNREIIESMGLSFSLAVEIKDYIDTKWSDVCCCAYSFNNWIVDDGENPWVREESRITNIIPKVGTLRQVLTGKQMVHKLMCMGDADTIKEITDTLRVKYPDLSISRSKDTYLEITDGSVKKSNAVRLLCERYQIPLEDTVSFGDNFNDIDMLTATGIGVAMGNAPAEVKAQASQVTLTNDQEGVLKVLEQLPF